MPARVLRLVSGAVLVAACGLAFTSCLGDANAKPQAASPPGSPAGKLCTIQGDKVLLSQALADLARQTGLRVEDVRGEGDPPLRLDLRQATFWQALDAIAAAVNARVNLYPASGRITLDKRGRAYRVPPLSYDGRFRLAVKKVTVGRDLELDDSAPGAAVCNLALEVAWGPDLQPLFLETRPHNLRLTDDRNIMLSVPNDGSEPAPVDGLISLVFDVRLPALPRSVARIRSLEGELSAIVPTKMLTFTFDTLDRLARAPANTPAQTLTQEGVTCEVRKVTLDRGRWSVQVVLHYPPGMKQLDSNQSWVVNNEMLLESTDGKKRLASSNYVVESATPRRAVLSYHFRDKDKAMLGKPQDWKVRYRTPANIVEVPIKFAFKDVRLP